MQDHDVWLTQKAIAQLFDVDRSVITKHLKNVFESGEPVENSVRANFAQVADNGKAKEADIVSARITKPPEEKAFQFSPAG